MTASESVFFYSSFENFLYICEKYKNNCTYSGIISNTVFFDEVTYQRMFEMSTLMPGEKPFVILEKTSRNIGLSTFLCLYALFTAIANRNKNVWIIADGRHTLRMLRTVVELSTLLQPLTLIALKRDDVKKIINVPNKSSIQFTSDTSYDYRGEGRKELVIFDTAACKNVEKFETFMNYAHTHNSKVFINFEMGFPGEKEKEGFAEIIKLWPSYTKFVTI